MISLQGLTPKDLGFGFLSWRPHQLETAERILNSKAKIVILSAPTGSGKSAIVQIPARVTQSRQVILTRTKVLQNQYETDGVLALYGRNNYACNIMPIKSAEYGKCRSGYDCHLRFGGCTYFDYKRVALVAQQTVLNYRYYFLEANGPGGFSNTDYLVCDEGHSVPEELSESFTIRFGNWEFKRFRVKQPEGSIKHWIDWAVQRLPAFAKTIGRYTKPEVIVSAQNFMRKLASLASIVHPENFIVIEDRAGHSIRPIWPDGLSQSQLFQHAKRFVFCSATINPWHLSRELGFSLSDVDFIQLPSTFPKENRPIYLRSTHSVRYGSTQLELHSLIRDIDKIIDEYPDKKGIVHTSNYALAETISNYSYHSRRIITHKSSNRIQALEAFKASKDAILVSPSMTEGIDLPYELCEFTIIAKLPFPNLKDPIWEARFLSDRSRANATYTSQVISTIIQAVGRGVRSATDYCDSWILDSAFNRLYQTHQREFPQYFREAIVEA